MRILVLLPLLSTSVFAVVRCEVTPPSPISIVRAEGISEVLSDVVLKCTQDQSGPSIRTLTVSIFLNTHITNRTVVDLNAIPQNQLDAILLIDEPPPSSQVLGENAIRGFQTGFNSAKFENLPAPIPGGAQSIYRITNVRANAAALGGGTAISPQRITAVLASDPPVSFTSFPALLDRVASALSARVEQPQTFRDCNGGNYNFRMRFAENFPAAFKTRAQEQPTAHLNPTLGVTDSPSGTRLKAVFSNIPFGTIRVADRQATGLTGSSPTFQATFVGDGTRQTNGTWLLPYVNGQATAIWEVTAADPTINETAIFDVSLTTTSGGTQNTSPAVGTYCVNFSMAPISSVKVDPSIAIPRFADRSITDSLLSLTPARTNLLFPFVTNAAGFDTGLAISNTSLDPFGSFGAAGACTVSSYGSNDPGFGAPQPFLQVQRCSPGGFSLFTRFPSQTGAPLTFTAPPSAHNVLRNGFVGWILGGDGQGTGLQVGIDGNLVSGSTPTTRDWLTVTRGADTTPSTLQFSIDPAGLAPGTYNKTVNVRAGDGQNASAPIILIIPAMAPSFERANVTHAGSARPGFVSPGQATVFYCGGPCGPPTLNTLALNPDGTVATAIGNTRILYDGTASPMIYAINGQVSSFAPFTLTGRPSTKIQIEYNGVKSPEVTVPVLQQNPSLLTLDSSGSGPVAAYNQDNTVNTAANGAAIDTIAQFFGTGGGQTNPASRDGQIGGPEGAAFRTPMSIEIDGRAAEIIFQGPSPSLAAGAFQINARIPKGTRSGAVPVLVRQGSQTSQPGNTIFVP